MDFKNNCFIIHVVEHQKISDYPFWIKNITLIRYIYIGTMSNLQFELQRLQTEIE